MAGTRRRGRELDAAILAAVADELRESGYGGLTFEGVARRAETSKSVLYRRWPTRLDLVVAALIGISEAALRPVDTGSMAEDVRATLMSVLDRFDSMGRGVALGVLADAVETPGATPLQLLRDKGAAVTDEILSAARARGEIGPEPIPDRIRTLAFDLARYEFIVNGDLTAAAVDDIIDTVFCPLVHAAAAGVVGDLVTGRLGR